MLAGVCGAAVGRVPGDREGVYPAARLLALLSGSVAVFGRFSSGPAVRAVAAWSTTPGPDEGGMMTVMCCWRPWWRPADLRSEESLLCSVPTA